MKDLLGSAWGVYKDLMGSAHLTFSQKSVIWKRRIELVNRYGEDTDSTKNNFNNVPLLVLINYNYMRTWPITNNTESGEIDEQSAQIIINKDYLKTNGYLNDSGYFNYQPDYDRLIIDGLQYKFFGDTSVAQMQDDDVHITFIVKRDITETGTNR